MGDDVPVTAEERGCALAAELFRVSRTGGYISEEWLAELLSDAIRDAENAALERASVVADDVSEENRTMKISAEDHSSRCFYEDREIVARYLAESIRALKHP